MKIITNNPLVAKEIDNIPIDFIEGSYRDVLLKAHRDIVENSYALLTHPLSGSIKPNETVYKSIIVAPQKSHSVDMESLVIVEKAIDVYDHFQEMRKTPDWNERILEDFAVVDFHIIHGAISQIQVPPRYL